MYEHSKYEDSPADMEEATKLMSHQDQQNEFCERYTDQVLVSGMRRLTVILWLNIALFVLLSAFAISTVTQRLRYHPLAVFFSADGEHFESQQDENHAWRQANSYSPIIDEISIPLADTHMKGTLIDYSHDIFRASPSTEVDTAWDALTEHGWAMIPESDAKKMGWDLSVTAKIPPSLAPPGSPSEQLYAGETDMIHKLHCLNMVRKDLVSNFPYYWGKTYPDGVPSERHQVHTNHCLYILLQALLCDANTDIIPSVYMDDYPYAVPDFEIQRKCGNWQGVKEWEETHRIMLNDTTNVLMMKPEGQKGRPMTDEFRVLFEVDTP